MARKSMSRGQEPAFETPADAYGEEIKMKGGLRSIHKTKKRGNYRRGGKRA
jgi:hypothetical protein